MEKILQWPLFSDGDVTLVGNVTYEGAVKFVVFQKLFSLHKNVHVNSSEI